MSRAVWVAVALYPVAFTGGAVALAHVVGGTLA